MRIHCDQCSQALDLPDDKIPAQRFSVTCPSCQNKLMVDPPGAQAPAAAAPAETAAPQQPAPPSPSSPGPSSQNTSSQNPSSQNTSSPSRMEADASTELATLRGLDRELIEEASQAAVIVHHETAVDARLEEELQRLDLREIHQASDLEAAAEMLLELDINLLLIRMANVPAPPCPPLKPIYKLPFDLRRKVFVALVADNVKTLDGQVAFYLQVNCLIQSAEPALAPKLRRAWLHDLRLYRHWNNDE